MLEGVRGVRGLAGISETSLLDKARDFSLLRSACGSSSSSSLCFFFFDDDELRAILFDPRVYLLDSFRLVWFTEMRRKDFTV